MSDLQIKIHGNVLEITLNRVTKRNALTSAMYSELADEITAAGSNDGIRAIAITAQGEDFCAGNDLKEFLGDYDLAPGSPWRRFIECLPAARKPLIASVHGNAVGIGLTMLLHFDIVFVEPTAKLSAPFARLGVVPEAGSSELLRRLIGPVRASEAFLLGRVFRAEESVQLGLANAMVGSGEGRVKALEAGQAIAKLPTASVRALLELKQTRFASLSDCIEAECQAFMACLHGPEAQAILHGLSSQTSGGSMLEKRRP